MKTGKCWRPKKARPDHGTKTVKQKPDFVFKNYNPSSWVKERQVEKSAKQMALP